MSNEVEQIVQQTEALLRLRNEETLQETTPQRLHECLGEVVMVHINDNWVKTKKRQTAGRRAFYFSAEYLVGRLVYSNLFNLGILSEVKKAFAEKGVDLACLEEIEDAALGNGGLGRLAACFLDSAATCDVPLTGYGLRYRFGLFKQSFENGSQREMNCTPFVRQYGILLGNGVFFYAKGSTKQTIYAGIQKTGDRNHARR